MKKFLVTLAATATFVGGAFAIAMWSPIGTAGAEETDLRHHHGKEAQHDRGEHFAGIAEVLGLEVEDLRSQLAEGATMAEIAGDNVDVLIAALVDDATEKINEAVAAEKMTQEEADEKIASLEENITERVNTAPKDIRDKRPPRGKEFSKGPRVSIQPVPDAAIQNLSGVSITAAQRLHRFLLRNRCGLK